MKITRVSIRKPLPLPLELATTVEHLLNDDQNQIKIWANMESWLFPRSDLFQFSAVLNRFDSILESVCREYALENSIQKQPFDQETKQMILAILNFSKLLFENCTNRNIYNSYEHLNNLLNTTDIDILEAVLRLMLKPAQRVNNPRAVQSAFLAHQDKVTELARGGSIADLTSTNTAITESKFTMSFYRTGEGSEEGLQAINIITTPNEYSDRELFWNLVEQHQIPKEYHFELLNRIRIANHMTEVPVKRQLLIIRFISIVIMAHTMSETIAQNRVFIYEPHIVPQIAQLISYDNQIPIDIQTYALYALDGIARHRTKVTEVLAAFNASANHGILLHILRQLCQPSTPYTTDFLDALFTLLSFLLQTPAGSTMLMSAGIMSTLIQVMDSPITTNATHTKALIKVVELLDTIMYNVNTSFSSFCSANGLDILLKVIQTQVDYIIATTKEDEEPNCDSLSLIKSSLRLLIRMMESSDTADGLRNLVESSIPHTIKKILMYHNKFKPSIFSLVVNVATTFIHNEPTSLSVLQEIQLPQTFLSAFATYQHPVCEVLVAAVHAFGAVCLNSAGLEMFYEANPLPQFFKLMTAPSFVTNASDVGNATVLGTAMDELIRHHPKLKGEVFKCANQLLQQVIEVGSSDKGKPLDNCHELVYQDRTDEPPAERAECLLLGFVDLASRFLEGFLRNTDNVKEFVKYGGPELLLKYYSLPMLPFDFSVSNAFDSLSFVFRMISDVSPMPFSDLIAKKVYESSRFIFSDLDMKKSTIYEYIEANGKDEESAQRGNALFKKFSILFGYVGLLSTVFASATLTNTKYAAKLVEWCVTENEEYGNMILLLGDIHRTTVWQNILLRESVPKSWYANQPSKDAADLKDSRVINVRRFKVVLSEIPPALMPVLQAIIKVSVSRRPLSSSSKHSTATRAKLVARDIAQMFHTSLHYMEQDGPLCKYDYYASMFSMISMLLLDDRSRTALETPIAVAFDMKGNVEMLAVTLLSQFWQAAENEMKAENQDESLLQRINTCIELLLAILHHLGSSKLFHNSPHTVLLTHSQPDRLGKQLNPHHWMASMQLKLSCLCQYLESPMLDKFSRHVLHSLLKCVTQNLKAEGERPRSNKALVKNAPSNSNPHYEMNRRELIAMGFEPDRVETALSSFEYGLCALDNLFSRSLVEHPVQSGPPQLEISPDLQSSNPLTDQEFEAGVRILVNMWYDQSIATELLRENNNLAQTALTLSRYEPSAIRTPSIGRAVQEAPTEGTNNAEDDDDQYEDIDTEDEANVSLYSSMDEDEHGDDELNTLFAGEKNYAVSNDSKKANDTLQQLDQKRTMMRTQIPPILAHLVDERNDIDFEVRDLMAVLCCGDPDRLPENTKQTMYLFFGGAASTITDKRSLFESSINKIRIFALMLREPAMQDVMSLLITTMSGYMDWFDFLDLVVKYPDFPDPKWLTTLFLILEAGLAQSDEPVEAPLPNVDGSLPETSSHDKPTTPAIVTPENRTTLMTYCIDLLQLDSLSQDNLIATLRIIVRLTKHHAAALQFVELGGLEALFKRPSKSFEALKVQQTYIIMILRHIIENKSVLMGCMREWFSFWFTVPNTRYLDAATFIRNNNNVALRDPESFLDVSTQLCRLSNYNSGNIKNIRYLDPSQQKESVQESINNEHSSIVIHFLLNQLVQIQQENEDDDESNIKIAYTGFLLQCIFELVSSYQSCKYDIMNFSTEALDHGSNHSHVRQSIHYKLVNMLLPYNAIHASNDQERKKQGISMWVTSLLVGMCYDTTHIHYQDSFADKDHHATMLSKVRKHVLDVVYRSFKDALQSDASTSTKYNHYFALTELCHRILNARPTSINPGLNIKEDTVMVVAKLMLDMNFVPILISVMSDVDVNYPHAKLILNSILRPLEQLTKLAIRIDRSAADEEKQVKQETIDAATDAMAAVRAGEDSVDDDDEEEEEEEEEDYLPMDTDEDNADAEDEVNDLYRNSSLAMFDGTALEEEESSEEDSDDDMEMASSGDEVIDDSSESGDGFETVSSSEGEEAAEDQEMDDLMRSHRFHHSDTEEEDNSEETDSDTDSDSDSGMSYSSSEYETGNESLNSDRSESIHSENDRDMPWQLDDITDGPDFLLRSQHDRRNRRQRQLIEAEIMTDNDVMDIDTTDDSSNSESEQGSELNAEELEDVERNLELFQNGARRDVTQLINPTVRGSLNNATGISSGAGRSFDRDSVILHPLLRSAATNINASASADGSLSAETAILSGANSNHLQAYEDIIGGSAVRILESLLNQHQQRQQDQGESTSNNASSSSPTVGATALNGDGTNDVDQSNKDTLSILKEFQPMQTADRWIQEVQMVYISAVASAKASKLTNTLIARLIKIAQEEKEQGISVINEDNAETVPESPTTDRGVGDIPWGIEIENGEPAEEEEEEEEEEIQEDPEERVTVMVNGEEVDITGTGIDVEFLEALPDDLRAEVLSQQMAERRSSIQSIEEYELSPEFLAALPSDIRTEVLRQDSRNHRQSRAFLNTDDMDQLISNQQGTRRHSSIPNSAVNVTELEGIQMHPNLGLAAHAFGNGPTPTRDSAHTTWRIGRTTEGNRADTSANHNSSKSRKGMVHRDAIRIVDRTQLATLARLIFVPQSISKALLNRLLLNLCENSKTRRDLLTLLISILRDGNTDLAAVDRTFMQMTAQKNNRQPTSRMEDSVIAKPAAAAAENVPNLIIQRCLEILYYVVTWNDRSLAYFFTESTNTGSMKRRHSTSSRKSKTKTFSGDSTKYPILTLIGLLDQPTFLANVTLMEQLMNLLATICRPFPSLVRKYKEKTDDNKTNDDTNEKPNHRTPKPPVIPAQYLERIVDVLSVGECSSHTFQYTVSVLSYLSHLDGALDTIIEGLTSTANECGRQIIIDIKQLLSILDTLKIGAELEGAALAQFSATTSHQARLLRVLKAMDYLYTRKRNATTTQAENEKAVLEIYNKLDFLPLWKMLGACLKVIRDREDLINVASVLLPLVESFMAVSKYSTNKGYINTTQEAGHAEEFFITFTEEHKKILNIMVRNNPSLMSGSFSLLIHNPKMLEFDNKRNYFAQQLHKRTEPRERYPPLRLTVRRAHVFEDTYQKLQGLSGKEIKYGKLNVQFHNEEGVDAGGVAREWFSVLARQMFDPNYALFVTSAADKLTYQPNRASGINSEHLNYFKCVGRIIGKAIHDGRLLDAYFTRSFYKLMLGRSVDYRDIETVDPAYYKSLVWMLDNDITDIIDLTFSIEVDDFGTNKIIDLKPNGRHIPVTEANKHEYVSLITEQRLVLAIKDQVNAFLEGFHDIIPEQLIQIFNEQELELLISGLPDIDIDEWKANTVYEGYTLSSPQIQWFWRAVRSFDQEERAKLLQFSTGTSKVPLEGFAQLQGSNGVQKFQIHKEFGDVNRLPSAHTCFNQIDLPQYPSYEELRSNLFKAISECSTGFAFQ